MSIRSTRELETTRGKLQLLKDRLQELEAEPVVNPRTRELPRRSLKKFVNQLREEIAQFESRASARHSGSSPDDPGERP